MTTLIVVGDQLVGVYFFTLTNNKLSESYIVFSQSRDVITNCLRVILISRRAEMS